MNRSLPTLALLFLAACNSEQSAPPESNEAAVTEAPATEKAVPKLEGQWTVTAIDGAPISAGSAMTASFAAGKAMMASGCLRRGWTYTQERNTVSFTNDPGSSANCGGGPSGEQESAYIALEQASIAIFNKEGKEASLSGTGGNLTLQR